MLYADVVVEPRALVSLARTPDEVALTYDQGWLARWRRRFDDPLDGRRRHFTAQRMLVRPENSTAPPPSE